MERISAGSNLVIEVLPESWRLLVNGSSDDHVLVEAAPGEPLHYQESFGSRRHLPTSGALARADIQRVALGWSESDTAWHLGLVLRGDLVTERGSRWCGLAHWYDPLANQYQNVAIQAGQSLAANMNCPFTFIPPHGGAMTVPETAPRRPPEDSATRIAVSTMEPAAEAIPQPELPIKLDLWTLKETGDARLELALSPAWGRSRLVRVAWNIVWLGVFIILTGTTLTSGIALPRPEILVYLGFASIIVLVLVIVYQLYQTMTRINRIVFEPAGVRWMRGRRVRRTIPIDEIEEVYVSHVIGKVGKRGKSSRERAVGYGELNLYLKDGEFKPVLTQPQTDEVIPVTDDPLNEESVVPLNEYNARTRLQSTALMIANTLGVSAEYDKRLR